MFRKESIGRPAVSVCIANFNGVDIIEDCIESVVNQTFSGEYEILVHDDASQDDSVDLIRKRFPDVKLILSSDNVGYCKSNNRLAEIASGEFLLFLNNDAVLFENALEKMFDESKTSGSNSVLSVTQYDIGSGNVIDHGYFLDPFFNPIPNLEESNHSISMVIGACLWISRELWEEADGFPDWFDTLAEDMYLCVFALTLGGHVRIASDSGYKHHVGYSLGGGKAKNNKLSTSFKRRRFSERNKTYILILFTPKYFLLPILTAHLVALALEGILLSLFKLDTKIWSVIYFFTFKALWGNRKLLIRERVNIQKRSKICTQKYLSFFRWFPHKVTLLLAHGIPNVR